MLFLRVRFVGKKGQMGREIVNISNGIINDIINDIINGIISSISFCLFKFLLKYKKMVY